MNPGLLDIRGSYQSPLALDADTPRRGASGASEPAFGAPCPIWLGRITSRPNTSDIAGGQRVNASITFLARWAAHLCEGGRICAEGRSYDVLTIYPAPKTPRRSWVHVECRHVKGVNSAARPVTAFAG